MPSGRSFNHRINEPMPTTRFDEVSGCDQPKLYHLLVVVYHDCLWRRAQPPNLGTARFLSRS
jgi:hypothetical protein